MLLLLLLSLAASPLMAQGVDTGFAQTSGPSGGLFWNLARTLNGDLYSGSQNGIVWRSTDNGTTWVGSADGIEDGRANYVVPFENGTILTSNGNPGKQRLYRSTDTGATWQLIQQVTDIGGFVRNLYPGGGLTAYARTDSGLVRTTDAGATWRRPDSAENVGLSGAWTLTDGSVIIWRWISNTEQRFYRTTDGVTWSELGGTFPLTSPEFGGVLSVTRAGDGSLVAGTLFSGVVRWSDSGGVARWELSREGLPTSTQVTAITAGAGGDVYAGTGSGIYLSSDYGRTWQPTDRRSVRYDVYGLVRADDGAILAATRQQIVRSTDRGGSWQRWANGILESDMIGLVVGGDTVFGTTTDGLLYRSTDAGASWSDLNPGVPEQTSMSLLHMLPDGTLFGGANPVVVGYKTSSILRSTDAGETWTTVTSGLVIPTRVNGFTANDVYLFMAGDSGVFRSSNQGGSWEAARTGLGSLDVTSIGALPDGTILAGTSSAGLWRSSDNGASWSESSTGLSNSSVRIIRYDPTHDVIIAAAARRSGGSRSTDGGLTWSPIEGGLPPLADISAIGIDSTGKIYLAVSSSTVALPLNTIWSSPDGGETWGVIDTLPGFTRKIEVNADGDLFASVSQYGVWSWSRGNVGNVEEVRRERSLNLAIGRNDISFTLARPASVEIRGVDLLGRLVHTSSYSLPEGRQSVTSPLVDLPHGLYVLQLVTPEGEASRTVLITD